MKGRRTFVLRRYPAMPIKLTILLSIFFFVPSCSTPRGTGPAPLTTFQKKVTALVTTSVRSHLREDTEEQKALKARLPSLQKKATMNELTDELNGVDELKELSGIIQKDVMFELGKPENRETKDRFNSPEVQREVVSAIILGMKRALQQLGGG